MTKNTKILKKLTIRNKYQVELSKTGENYFFYVEEITQEKPYLTTLMVRILNKENVNQVVHSTINNLIVKDFEKEVA